MISYEVSIGIIILSVIICAGSLNLTKIPSFQRKKLTSSSQPWNPPLYFEGKLIKNVPFDAWKTRFPKNRGELSNKLIQLYLPAYKGDFISYFPYWIEVVGAGNQAKIRVKDSGHGLKSPIRYFPKR